MKYLVKKWESEEDREQGISDIEARSLSLKDSLDLCKKIVDLGLAVVAEVLTENEENCIITYEGEEGASEKLFLELCKGCIEDLNEYNPYINENQIPISLSNIVCIEVDIDDCNNTEHNLGIKTGVLKYI